MKFGVSTFLTDEGIGPAALGPALEERGFDALLLAEHSHIPVKRETPYPGGGELPRVYYRTLDPFVALGAVASVTSELLLGTGIALVVQRDPIHTAKEVASLDLVSGGRAVFGVGAGWNREEMRNHRTDPTERGRLMDERIRAIIELWTKDEAEFHGDFVDFAPVYSWPKPVQRPHPPIWVGGGSERTFARVAEYGAAWMPSGVPPKELGAQIERMRKTAGDRPAVVVYAAQHDRESLDTYAELGVERVLLYLPTQPEDETLRTLDELAEAVSAYR
ncbi:LLM class F420-dependent oxidoreductase [Streptomyces avermitilis]|uniref:N5,N10-methylenetetrahydromethanopterin reductase-related protein n=2 Tax=Streptomyces avermitilis TaxID=33903 RepID=Q825H3_STRAW|nr:MULTISPECIES: LLM class F420-dependent oxidoreductase [Streptomyces]KUN50081.1 LLM class F420-dependent oxidoreductase [Streptomyces avermitilis]MYT03021.1 TIGR03619 family F420-dependent LLM class oxidoreductase [Streptomyces sp. SID5469]OOV26159.1 LLM class F420-dependent oxidoreductase [Streptomyces avermitilis]BAC75195.1 putative N5,N10-methylenetetrahydromethanopterin reductase-related protein [Streptomyces avermitilis MA-4680 = NBRC 14893]BBJ55848.1 LLM class F420-dependent oxidoreduc